MPPTETPFPTLVPTPVPGVDFYHDMQLNAPLMAGAVWAVLILFLFVLLTRPRLRTINILLLFAIVTLPLAFLNSGIWAITLYLFVLVFQVLSSIFRLIE